MSKVLAISEANDRRLAARARLHLGGEPRHQDRAIPPATQRSASTAAEGGYGVRSERRAVLGSLPRRAGGPEPCRDGCCRPGRGTWWCRSGSRSSRSVLDRSRSAGRSPSSGCRCSLAPIFGPILGGVIIDEASLRWVFVVNLPIATVAIAAVALERDVRPVRRLDDPHRAVRVARRSLARRLIDVGLFRSPRFRAAALGGRVSPLRSSGRSCAAALRPARARQERAAGLAPSSPAPGV
jgi:hypothetical protein